MGRIVIIGAGPAGLGCAWKLYQGGHADFNIYESNPHPGGLSASFTDPRGFVWDIGAHLHFRKRLDYIELLQSAFGGNWVVHGLEARIWTHGRLIHHPFQLHVRELPDHVRDRCIAGLREAKQDPVRNPVNLAEWIRAVYGNAIADEFLVPYCRKAWSYDPAAMSVDWARARFPAGDTDQCLDGASRSQPRIPYPADGGNGGLWRWVAEQLGPRVTYSRPVARIETKRKLVWFSDGTSEPYDTLVSTMPLDQLIARSDRGELAPVARELQYVSLAVVGIGIRGVLPDVFQGAAWIYCADPTVPFYRATVQSSLSPRNAPPGHWSLLTETSHRPGAAPSAPALVRDTLEALRSWGIGVREDEVASVWMQPAERAYPVPSIGREPTVAVLLDALREHDVHSCGRFGAWRYENANQDDCFAEGTAVATAVMADSFTSSRKRSGRA